MSDWYENPTMLVGVAVGVSATAALLAFVMRSKLDPKAGDRRTDALLRAGNYVEAARIALEKGNDDEAIDYYLRAQQPARAAQVAQRRGQMLRAGELYERAGDNARAAKCFEACGRTDRVAELGGAFGLQRAADLKARAPMDAVPATDLRAASTQVHGSLAHTSDPVTRAQHAERDARALLEKVAGDPSQRGRLEQLAETAAEQLMAVGEVRRAADLYRDAGLFDEAVQVYANVLGAPGEAAPLVARSGNHERAAELYELAGQRERAAGSWATAARASQQPERYLDRIEQLSPPIAVQFITQLIGGRVVARETARLNYRLANALERTGERERALQLFADLRAVVGNFADIEQRIVALQGPAVPRPSSMPAATVPPQPERDLLGGHELLAADVTRLAAEAVRDAVDRLRRGHDLSADAPAPVRRGTIVQRADRGLERVPLEISILLDERVKQARDGITLETLRKFTGDRDCDLGNIEVYYRLGLAHLAAGRWEEAREAFEEVESASPGYRDAERRAGEIARWKDAMGRNAHTSPNVADETRTGSRPDGQRYEVLGELGRGGMAVVYRASDTVLARDIALKFLSEEFSAKAEMREMFQREARSVASLNHPNIVTVYDFGMMQDRLFIAMEYLEGSSVEALVDERGRLTVLDALRTIKQVLDALAYAHARNIVHRDIKPSNMMRTATGLVKLMDFGLAKSLAENNAATMIAGTPAYMPPEQFVGKSDHRSDFYAVGVSLYEMLTGQLPFATVAAIGQGEFISVREWNPNAPELIDEILKIALDPDPNARFQSAAAFANPIGRILDAVAAAAADPSATGTALSMPPGEPALTEPGFAEAPTRVAFH